MQLRSLQDSEDKLLSVKLEIMAVLLEVDDKHSSASVEVDDSLGVKEQAAVRNVLGVFEIFHIEL